MSDPVDVITRAVKVDELNPWSIVRIRYCSRARIARSCGRSPVSIWMYDARIAEIRVRLDRLETEVVAVQAHQQHRDDRRHLEAFLADFVGGDVERRLLLERGAGQGHRRTQRHQRRVPGQRRDARAAGPRPAPGIARASTASLVNALQLRIVGQLALDEQVPDLLERAAAGQLGGVVAAVVEEALLAAHVAHRGLGDGHTLESARREPGRCRSCRLDLLDMRDADDVADREDAGDMVAVHHGEVAEAPLAEDLEPLLHGVGDRDGHGVLGHDLRRPWWCRDRCRVPPNGGGHAR